MSIYFNLYFPNENLKDKIKYEFSEYRHKLHQILDNFSFKESLKLFKFTGPSGIGKSFSLFVYSRAIGSRIYFNIKLLYKLQKNNQILKLKNIIIEESNRINIIKEDDRIKLTQKINQILYYETLIKEIITILLKYKFTIILDQFKSKYINKFEETENLLFNEGNLLKIIICSSINDKLGLNSIEFINNLITNQNIIYNKDVRKKYFYITFLLDNKDKKKIFDHLVGKNIVLKKVIAAFNYIPKYAVKFLKTKNIKNELLITKLRINDNLKEYHDFSTEEELSFYLINLKQLMYIKLDINQLNEIKKRFLWKYFILIFYSNNNEVKVIDNNNISEITHFEIRYNFDYMHNILNEHLINIQYAFFSQNHFKFHTGCTFGGYFEFIAIDEIKNGHLPLPEKSNSNLRLKNISNMNEVYIEIDTILDNTTLYIKEEKEEIKGINQYKEEYSLFNYSPDDEKDKDILFYNESGIEKAKNEFLKNNKVSIYGNELYQGKNIIKHYIKSNIVYDIKNLDNNYINSNINNNENENSNKNLI